MLVRKDALTSQKVETALIFQAMLGWQDAYEYLLSEDVPEEIIERVVFGGARRPSPVSSESYNPALAAHLPAGLNHAFYVSSGRRKDILRMAVVQAALTLREQLGSERVEQMLRREKLPEQVIERVLLGEACTLRVRPATTPTE